MSKLCRRSTRARFKLLNSRAAQGSQGKDLHGNPLLSYPKFRGLVKSLELLSSLLSEEKPSSVSHAWRTQEGSRNVLHEATLPSAPSLVSTTSQAGPCHCSPRAWHGTRSHVSRHACSKRMFLPTQGQLTGGGTSINPLSRTSLTINGINRHHLI